jgi:hypothetical protein
MAGATDRQGMLTPPRHLIPPPVFPWVRVSPFVYLTCNSYLISRLITVRYLGHFMENDDVLERYVSLFSTPFFFGGGGGQNNLFQETELLQTNA